MGDNRSPIAVIGHKEPEMLIAFLAAVKSGRPYVPIDSSLPGHRIDSIMFTADSPITLTPLRIAETTGDASAVSCRRVEGGDAFYVIITSGCTGAHKLVS